MATSVEVCLLGVFEDRAQQDFLQGLCEAFAARRGVVLTFESRLTDGCQFDYLNHHLVLAAHHPGVIIGVDANRHSVERKVELMQRRARVPAGAEVLWSVAVPSIEEWVMADEAAVHSVLSELTGASHGSRLKRAPRPGRSNAERTAKQRLSEWTRDLLGEPLLQGGREYAYQIGARVDPARVGPKRNPDLRRLLDEQLPAFLDGCRRRAAGA
ncbi:MAG: hypothetical protein KF878_35210 [Planctomycetes bacterium]|nr:hypothetical protein [Planctomycetota bacterium]